MGCVRLLIDHHVVCTSSATKNNNSYIFFWALYKAVLLQFSICKKKIFQNVHEIGKYFVKIDP